MIFRGWAGSIITGAKEQKRVKVFACVLSLNPASSALRNYYEGKTYPRTKSQIGKEAQDSERDFRESSDLPNRMVGKKKVGDSGKSKKTEGTKIRIRIVPKDLELDFKAIKNKMTLGETIVQWTKALALWSVFGGILVLILVGYEILKVLKEILALIK